MSGLIVSILYLVNPIKYYFDPATRFERAWDNNDSIFIKNYILKLGDKSIEEIGAISETILSEITGFPYGMMLYKKEFWDTIPPKRKEIIKYNIVTVWSIYARSKLFMKKGCQKKIRIDDRCKLLHKKYNPIRSIKFTNEDIRVINGIIDEIGNNCEPSAVRGVNRGNKYRQI